MGLLMLLLVVMAASSHLKRRTTRARVKNLRVPPISICYVWLPFSSGHIYEQTEELEATSSVQFSSSCINSTCEMKSQFNDPKNIF